jgi:hypothetical protein
MPRKGGGKRGFMKAARSHEHGVNDQVATEEEPLPPKHVNVLENENVDIDEGRTHSRAGAEGDVQNEGKATQGDADSSDESARVESRGRTLQRQKRVCVC